MPTGTKAILDLLFAVRAPKEVAMAPDGRSLAWVEPILPPDRTEPIHSLIQLLDEGGAAPRRLTAGDGAAGHAEKAPRWSPDGKWIAFLSDWHRPKQLQLYLQAAAGGPVSRLTEISGQMASPQWSPDGRTVALLVVEGQQTAASPVAAGADDDGEVAEKILEQRILLVDIASGRTRTISPDDRYVYEYDWSPDSRAIAYCAAAGSGDSNYWLARLYAVEVQSGRVRELHRPKWEIASPRWSPEGRTVAFIEGLMSDQGLTGGDIWAVPAAGGPARNLTPGRPSSPSWLKWRREPDQLLFTEWIDGGCAVSTLNVSSGESQTLWRGDKTLGTGAYDLSLAVSADGRTSAGIFASWDHPPEIWSGPIGAWKQRSHLNGSLRPLWGRTEKLDWSSDGQAIQGWLLYPRDFDPAQRYPMIVSVHGGPAAQRCPSWPEPGFNPTVMAAEGYFVFFPNPRGSYGRGEAFTQGNVKDFGHGDLRDILGGVDAVLKLAPVDPNRLGIAGWSYGGYMVMWAVTQTQRFRAAVGGAGIANWQSYYGQNQINQWLIPYFGASVYDDPAVYARSSPIECIKNVRTPTLIMAGGRDKICPPAQSYEYWSALKTLGVKTKLVVYAGEGHGMKQPAHLEDVFKRMIAWFDEHLPANLTST